MEISEVSLPQFFYVPIVIRSIGGYGREFVVGNASGEYYLFRDYSLVKNISSTELKVVVGRDYVYIYGSRYVEIYDHDLNYVMGADVGYVYSIGVNDDIYILHSDGSIDVYSADALRKIQTVRGRIKPLGIGVVDQGVIVASDMEKNVNRNGVKMHVNNITLYDFDMNVKKSVEYVTMCNNNRVVSIPYSFASISDSIIMSCLVEDDVLITIFTSDLEVRGVRRIHVYYKEATKHNSRVYMWDLNDANNKRRTMLGNAYINNEYVMLGVDAVLTLVPVPWVLSGESVNYKTVLPQIAIAVYLTPLPP